MTKENLNGMRWVFQYTLGCSILLYGSSRMCWESFTERKYVKEVCIVDNMIKAVNEHR